MTLQFARFLIGRIDPKGRGEGVSAIAQELTTLAKDMVIRDELARLGHRARTQ
jgi:hypothetical protein